MPECFIRLRFPWKAIVWILFWLPLQFLIMQSDVYKLSSGFVFPVFRRNRSCSKWRKTDWGGDLAHLGGDEERSGTAGGKRRSLRGLFGQPEHSTEPAVLRYSAFWECARVWMTFSEFCKIFSVSGYICCCYCCCSINKIISVFLKHSIDRIQWGRQRTHVREECDNFRVGNSFR